MIKKLSIFKQNNQITLSKTKKILKITNKILVQKKELSFEIQNINSEIEYLSHIEQNLFEIDKILEELEKETNNNLIDNSWIEKLWEWADENSIPDYYLAKDSDDYVDTYNFAQDELSFSCEEIDRLKYIDMDCLHSSWYYCNIGEYGLSRDYKLLDVNRLHLSSSNLIKLPKELSKLINLKELYLSDNLLEEIPKELFELSNLEELYLDYNKLKKLPNGLSGLVNLKRLSLRNNLLEEIPKELFELSNLELLDLGNNELKKLPNGLSKLKKLKTIILSGNNLEEFPNELLKLKNIEILFLGHNQFDFLTEDQHDLCDSMSVVNPFGSDFEDFNPFKVIGSDKRIYNNIDDLREAEEEEIDTHVVNERIELNKSSIQGNFMSNKFNGLLVDINNINGIEINGKTLFLRTKYSGKILIYEYEYEYEAKEDKMVFQGVLNNDLCKVVLIYKNYDLRGYPSNSEEYKELQMGFNYAVIDGDEKLF